VRRTVVIRTTIAALALLSGCFGTETGNPPFAPGVAGGAGGTMGIVPVLQLDEGWLAIDDLTFLDACVAGSEGVVVRSEPGALGLGSEPVLETDPVLEEGEYCGVRAERVAWTSAAPSALRGYTLAIDASRPDGTPVRIRSTRTGTLELLGGAPFPMSPASGGVLLFVTESLLFNGLAFDGVELALDGSIVVSAEKNAALLERIEAQLPGALALYRDADGDGRLSMEEERAGPLSGP